jgi:hypothetical protein
MNGRPKRISPTRPNILARIKPGESLSPWQVAEHLHAPVAEVRPVMEKMLGEGLLVYSTIKNHVQRFKLPGAAVGAVAVQRDSPMATTETYDVQYARDLARHRALAEAVRGSV